MHLKKLMNRYGFSQLVLWLSWICSIAEFQRRSLRTSHWDYPTEIRENHVTLDYSETPVNALDLMESHNTLAKKGWELVAQS